MARATLAFAVAVLLGACSGTTPNKAGVAGPATTTLTMAQVSGDYWPQQFVDQVRSLSNGSLTIQPRLDRHRGDPDREAELLADVVSGREEMAAVSVLAFHSAGIRSFDALAAPFLVDSYALEGAILADGPLVKKMADAASSDGIAAVGLVPGPLRRLEGLKKAFRNAADFRGAKVGTSSGWVGTEAFGALGATTVPELYDQEPIRGDPDVLDLRFWTFDAYGDRGWFATTNVALWAEPLVVILNRDRFAALTPEQRKILAAGLAASAPLANSVYAGDRVGELLCRRGLRFVTASSSDIGSLRSAVQPVYDALETDALTKDAIGEIAALKAALPAADALVHCAAEPSAGATFSALEGTWQACFTKAEFYAAGADLGERPVYDTMCLTVRFDNGAFTDSLGNGQYVSIDPSSTTACDDAAMCYGTYVVSGNTITITDTGGEQFTSTWSVFNDTLTLGGGLPTFFIVKALHAVGG